MRTPPDTAAPASAAPAPTAAAPAPAPARARPASLRLIALCAAASLLPLLLLHGQFQRLYWFGDEWDLLLDLKEAGFWSWVLTAYGENFAPLFKLLWGGALLLGGGNYAMIITLCWLNHALAVLLLGVLLSRAGWGRPGCALALLVFGLSTTNLEVLGWSMQWDVVLSATFLLAGALVLQRAAATFTATRALLLALCVLASGLSFSRGVITGPALLFLALPPFGLLRGSPLTTGQRTALASAALFPSLLVALGITAFGVPSNVHGFLPYDRPTWILAWKFANAFFLLNPLAKLGGPRFIDGLPSALVGAIKVAVIASALFTARRRESRALLGFLLAFDLANAALVALGRYWTLPVNALSSRYQYGPLFCFFASAGALVDALAARPAASARRFAAAAVAACALVAAVRWPKAISAWAEERGDRARAALQRPFPPDRGVWPHIPPLHASSAKELVERFHLH